MRPLDLVLGVGADSGRAWGWLDAHPGACLVIMLLCALAVCTADGWFA